MEFTNALGKERGAGTCSAGPGEEFVFAECKKVSEDQIRDSQKLWLQSALHVVSREAPAGVQSRLRSVHRHRLPLVTRPNQAALRRYSNAIPPGLEFLVPFRKQIETALTFWAQNISGLNHPSCWVK